MQAIIYKLHHNGTIGIVYDVPLGKGASVVERVQRCAAKFGHPTGVTWQAAENDLVGAMVASRKL